MTTVEFLTHLFCLVDDRLGDLPKHPQARLWPSELVTLGLLCALKGGSFRAFYRWLARDYRPLFPDLPDRTRLLRGLRAHQTWAAQFLADPTLLTVIDSDGIELIHPWREGRSPRQIGGKGFCGKRWIVGVKLCWLLNRRGEVVAWDWNTANTHDQHFVDLVRALDGQTVTYADQGFHARSGDPPNLKICKAGVWNERMFVETALSLAHRVFHLKHLTHRLQPYLEARLAFVSALFNVLLALNHQLDPTLDVDALYLHLAQYSL